MTKESAPMFVPWLGLLFALLGLAWCGYIAFPTAHSPLLCETSGCALLQDGKIFGLSLWWIGGGYFLFQSLLCLRGKRIFAWNLSRFALILDCILLLIMFFSGPCFNCLIVAMIFAALCLALRPPADAWFLGAPHSLFIVPIWLGLFLGNVSLAINETIPPLTIGNNDSKEVRIYFAPSCTYCREALVAFGNTASLYPVKEKEEDTESILRLQSLLQAQVPMKEAVRRCLSSNELMPELSTFEYFLFQIQLFRNKATVFRNGIHTLPLILINGMPVKKPLPQNPASVSAPPQDLSSMPNMSAPDGVNSFTSPDALPHNTPNVLPNVLQNLNQSGLNTCGGENPVPCPE